MKQMKDDINSLTVNMDQIKLENSKLKDVKKQKDDYIQVLLTEKQLLHEEIRDLKISLQNTSDSTNNNIGNLGKNYSSTLLNNQALNLNNN